jgi:hypothetical protein
MADSKITALTALTAADPVNDMFPVVDVSDTSMAASGTTKRISANNILSSSPTASGALTVTGLVTAGSATITGAATVGTTLGVTGVSTLASAVVTGDLTARTTGLIVNATGVGMGMTPVNSLDVGSALYASVGTKIDSITQSSQIFKGTPDAVGYEFAKIVSGREASPSTYGSFLAFYTESKASGTTDTSVERARFNSTGNLAFANGKGIDFSAVTGGTGTATANVLNDYEEGTFTATLNGSVANPTVTQSTTGRYTKVGRQVTVQIFFNNVDTTGASGGIQVIGLPFANNGAVEAISIAGFINMAVFTGSIFGLTLAGSTSIGMYSSQSSGSAALVTYNAGAVQYLWANLTYTV